MHKPLVLQHSLIDCYTLLLSTQPLLCLQARDGNGADSNFGRPEPDMIVHTLYSILDRPEAG